MPIKLKKLAGKGGSPSPQGKNREKHEAGVNPYLGKILKSFRRAFKAVFVFSFFINLLMLSVPLYLLHIYDKVIPNHSSDTLYMLTAIVVIAIVALAALESLRRSVLIKLGTWFEKNVGEHLFASTIVHSLNDNSGKSANVIRDLSQLRSFVSGSSLISGLDLPWTPIYIAFLYFLHPFIGSLSLFTALLLFGLAYLNETSTRNLVRSSQHASRSSMDSVTAYARNADVIEAMGMRSQIQTKWRIDKDQALSLSARANTVNARINSVVKFIRLMLQISVIGFAAWLILQGELTPGATIASVLLMRRAVAPLENSISSWKSFLKAREAFARINRHLDASPSLQKTVDMPPPEGQLSVEKISFKHSNAVKPIFRQISFKVNPGEAVALVGSTAAGKTTMARVLTGLIQPSSGTVRMGGFDLRQWTSEQRGPMIGYLPQDVELFSGTVRENIARMQEGDITKIIEAAETANVHDIIQRLPQGYETEIGENGAYLSGGQRQRIALARALYDNPRLVILDEPDANLDTKGRAALAIAIQKLKRQGAIVLLITHHKGAQQFVDRVLELKKGMIPDARAEKKSTKLRVVGESKGLKRKGRSGSAGSGMVQAR